MFPFSIPNNEDLQEKTNYYQNYMLKEATDAKGSFYVDVQGIRVAENFKIK